MSDVLKQLQDVIRKSLPEQVGAELKKYLEEAEKNAGEVGRLGRNLKEAQDHIVDLKGRVSRMDAALTKAGDLEKKELELEKRERDMQLTLSTEAYRAESERANSIERLVEKVFTYRRHVVVNEHGTIPVAGSNGYVGGHDTQNEKTVTES